MPRFPKACYTPLMTDEPKKKPAKDDPIATAILDMLGVDGTSMTFKDIAMKIFEARRRPKDRADGWRKYMTAVKQQILHMARLGRVEILRKGEVADPNNFKGIVKVRRAHPKVAKAIAKAKALAAAETATPEAPTETQD